MNQREISERRRQVLMMGAGAVAAPVAMAMPDVTMQGAWEQADARAVVSGRVIDANSGGALAGAHIEIWRADARGTRDVSSCVVVTADGDGRYFAIVEGRTARLYYRVSHASHVTRITQLHAHGAQRAVTRLRDESGVSRSAFELALRPGSAAASEVAAL